MIGFIPILFSTLDNFIMTNEKKPTNVELAAVEILSPSSTSRHQQLVAWLQKIFKEQRIVLESLPGDASSRQYHRLQLSAPSVTDNFEIQSANLDSKNALGADNLQYIVMDSAAEQEAMRHFINVSRLLSSVVKVPRLIAQELEQGFLVLQDFGTVEFAHLLTDATTIEVDEYYQSAMQTLIALQKLPIAYAKSQHQLPLYDAELLNREMDLFSEWFVPYIGVPLDQTMWSALKRALIEAIMTQPQVIVHRDYHSRNLMQDQADKTQLGVIDFQDAVIGAYSYDLVSLVRDAYVAWPEPQVSAWIHNFWQQQQQAGLTTATSAEQFEADVNVMGIQRHLKVLGIFIRLSERDGKARYLADIPKVMSDLLFEIDWLSTNGDKDIQQALQPFRMWLNDTALSRYQNKFA